jgi:hypothetical protein
MVLAGTVACMTHQHLGSVGDDGSPVASTSGTDGTQSDVTRCGAGRCMIHLKGGGLVDCRPADSCEVLCEGGDCLVLCGAVPCRVDCQGGATCELRCTPSGPSTCGAGVAFTCNGVGC